MWRLIIVITISFFNANCFAQKKIKDYGKLKPVRSVVYKDLDTLYIDSTTYVLTASFYDNGKVRDEGFMIQKGNFMVKEGVWVTYNEVSGSLKKIGEYTDDKENGIWRYFDKDGVLVFISYFEQGKRLFSKDFENSSNITELEKLKLIFSPN